MAVYDAFYRYIAVDKFSRVALNILSKVKQFNNALDRSSRKMSAWGRGMIRTGRQLSVYVTTPVIAFAGAALRAASNVETLSLSFTTFTKSADIANKLTYDLLKLSTSIPIAFSDIGESAQTLLRSGVGVDQVTDKIKQLGDIAAVTGTDLNDLAYIYGNVLTKRFLDVSSLDNLREKGVPIFDSIRDSLKEMTGQTFNDFQIRTFAQNSRLSSKVLVKAFDDMTKAGSSFANGLQRKTLTIGGSFIILRNILNKFLVSTGNNIASLLDLGGILNKVSTFLENASQRFDTFIKQNPELAKNLLIIISLLIAIPPLLFAIGVAARVVGVMVAGFAALVKGITFVINVIKLLRVAMILLAANPLALTLSAITLALYLLYENFGAVKQVANDFFGGVLKFFAPIKELFDFIIGGVEKIGNFFSSNKAQTATLGMSGPSTMLGQNPFNNQSFIQTKTNNAQANIDINLKDPGKQIRSVSQENNGFSKFNLGANNSMAFST